MLARLLALSDGYVDVFRYAEDVQSQASATQPRADREREGKEEKKKWPPLEMCSAVFMKKGALSGALHAAMGFGTMSVIEEWWLP